MKKKSNLFKNVFYTFFALCFLGAGIFTLSQNENSQVFAEDTSYNQAITNNAPDYFLVKDTLGDISNPSSLIDEDTFMYFVESGNETNLELSLAMNGSQVNTDASNEIFNCVYYPDENNLSLFYYYNIGPISLYRNGESINLDDKNFIQDCGGHSFPNALSPLQGFEMVFNSTGAGANEIGLFQDGEIVEGVYTLTLTITLFQSNNGTAALDEILFTDRTVDITYSFYVVDRDQYLTNNRPNIDRFNFDHSVSISNSTSLTYAYYLYYNYSSESTANKIPYIEFDYTRFELSISKDISNSTYTENILFDKDTQNIVTTGDDIVYITSDAESNLCKVYFTDVGNYTITFNDIQIVQFQGSDGTTSLQKNNLTAMSNITKRVMVYVYGYQANYTDIDGERDESGTRPVAELKDYNFQDATFDKSADITSEFINSNENYSQETGNTTFLIRNVVDYIGDKEAVKTNQTPIRFSSNASLSSSITSYIYSTTRVSNAYTETIQKLNGETLYRTSFVGRAESTAGKYIYIIAYNFNNYYTNETTLSTTTTFYQVFYFEITKDLPTISVQTEKVEEDDVVTEVFSDTFVNKSVRITDLTQNFPYNKDVTIRIYARDFSGNYLSSYGGRNGVTFESLSSTGEADVRILEDNAHYTIRMYFTNEMTSSNSSIDSNTGFFREQSFTIDKTPIQNIMATNVSAITNSTNYTVVSTVTGISTNQNIVLSWDEKDSGAKTYAYYRYFSLSTGQYYSRTDTESVSSTIETMLNALGDASVLPINAFLNMSTDSNIWLEYTGNSKDFLTSGTISSEYVFTEAGLYLVDVYDSAGNHSVELYIIDYTSPVFAVYEDEYSIISSSIYISKSATLYWGQYKGIFIQNFDSQNYFSNYDPGSIDESQLTDELFKTYDKKVSKEIYDTIYNKLFANKYMQQITCRTSTAGSDLEGLTNYSGMYVTIPINPLSYYIDRDHVDYTAQTGVYSREFVDLQEMTFRILVRDASNTKFLTGYSENSVLQYTNYYSASQTILISFDDSEFMITYENSNGSTDVLSSNIAEEEYYKDESGVEDENKRVKTTYLSPTSLSKNFSLSFIPTKIDGDITIQVASVVIKYYPYQESTRTITETNEDGETISTTVYHYYEISDTSTTTTVYEYNGVNGDTETREEPIRLNSENITTEGRYEITRTYYVDESDPSREYYNSNDFYQRTFIFTVDRNEVVKNPDLVTDENGSHLESLVGGDIFVSMYDNKQNASLVVTFPDSPNGNSTGSSIYNNDNTRTILTTNMLPVYVYVPQYKYTTYSDMQTLEGGYDFDVNYDFDEDSGTDTMNKFEMNDFGEVIREYAIFARIYKDTTVEQIKANAVDPYAMTATNDSGRLDSVVANENGFLNFYRLDGTQLNYLSEPGTYFVEIIQGNFGLEIGENSYNQSLIFSFEIQKTNPDFTAQSTTGETLRSTVSNNVENYYTNQPIINLTWDAGADYIAEIDIDEITFATSRNPNPVPATWAQAPTLENGTYTAQINLELLNIYENNGYVDITMQYKNHDDRFYSKVTKRINVDLSAPSTNIQNLVSKTTAGNLIPTLTESALRVYQTALGGTTSDLSETSYNISNGTGNFAYYSYVVTQDFVNTLKQNKDYKTYVGKFENSDGENTKYDNNYEQEISPENFHASNFTDIDNTSFTGFDTNSYYQVIETDLAGNLSIYTVYVTSYNATSSSETVDLISYSYNTDDETINTAYTSADYLEARQNGAINNIYSRTSFQLQNINYFGDVWAQFRLDTYSPSGTRETRYLMLTPWDPTHAYEFVGENVTRIEISDLIDGSTSIRYKNAITFYNRENQSSDAFYINIRNVSLPATLTDTQTREYIRFNQPTDTQLNSTTTPQTFVTSVKISVTATGSTQESILFDKTNKLGLSTIWRNSQNENVSVSYDSTFGYLTFEINASLGFTPNTRIVYEYVDNYGTSYKEIHLYHETIISTEITSENDLYAYYNERGTLYYITQDGFIYNYNPSKYSVDVYDVIGGQIQNTLTNATASSYAGSDGITTLTLKTTKTTGTYNDSFAIEVKDRNDLTNLVKTIYVVLYNELPTPNTTTSETSPAGENNEPGEFKLLDASRNNVTSTIISGESSSESGYFSEITLLYSNNTTFFPIKYSISTDGINWTEAPSGTVMKNTTDEMMTYYLKIWYDETYMTNELSNSTYIFEYVPTSQIYTFNLSSLTSTFWIEKTINGVTEVVEKQGTIYIVRDADGKVTAQYSNHYIVNVDYYTNSDAINIKTNQEQKIDYRLERTIEEDGIATEIYLITNKDDEGETLGNIPAFETRIAISYIPDSENFVQEFFTYKNENGIINNTENSENLITLTTKRFYVPQDYSQLDRIELKWTKYYGIEQNEIRISLIKDGVELNPTIYSKTENGKDYNYIYLTHSGKYTISLYDLAGNVQKFNYGYTGQTENMTFIFLKDVPFTVTSTDASTGETVTGTPIKQAIYNDRVVLSVDKATRSEFYAEGGYPTITITKNGTTLTNDEISQKGIIQDYDGKINYVFTESGYYEIFFTATSNDSSIGQIRQETYQFTLLSANEYKYSYIINKYSNYYIEKVVKDGRDVTDTLRRTLNVDTLTLGDKAYMTELPLSYLDEKTGAGRYVITVNSNDNTYNSSAVPTSWTFEVTIKVGSAPLSISVEEGKGTTKQVDIVFNQANIFAEMGECVVRVLKYTEDGEFTNTYYTTNITSQSQGQATINIDRTDSGIFYMQIVSPSGNLLYSYKIVKNEPMNTASIIIIVVAVILALVIVLIIVKLRKKISVK